mmetsp:Transcript_8470/g.27342  ORF Transcript_8470/g.27342 Transcript_8470/m.27342 type:complete len:218 (+) Transcript_8470:732-1385(+)
MLRRVEVAIVREDTGREACCQLQVRKRLGHRGQVVGDDDVPERDWRKRRDDALHQRADQRAARRARQPSREQRREQDDEVQRQVRGEPRPPSQPRRLAGDDVGGAEAYHQREQHTSGAQRRSRRLNAAAQHEVERHAGGAADADHARPAKEGEHEEDGGADGRVLPEQLAHQLDGRVRVNHRRVPCSEHEPKRKGASKQRGEQLGRRPARLAHGARL